MKTNKLFALKTIIPIFFIICIITANSANCQNDPTVTLGPDLAGKAPDNQVNIASPTVLIVVAAIIAIIVFTCLYVYVNYIREE